MSEKLRSELNPPQRLSEGLLGLTIFTMGTKEPSGILLGLGAALIVDSTLLKGRIVASVLSIMYSQD